MGTDHHVEAMPAALAATGAVTAATDAETPAALHPIDVDVGDFADIDAPLLHDRVYRVRVYAERGDLMRVRGVVRDTKPAGLYVRDDPDPLVVHHMAVDLLVSYPGLQIIDARVVLETHPHPDCPRIEDHYRELIGLSIARGFTHEVRARFGGPRGCTHTTALLQAMGPVAVQATWSMRAQRSESGSGRADARPLTPDEREARLRFNIDSCHVWADGGDLLDRARAGETVPVLLPVARRTRALGKEDPEAEWKRWMER